MTYSLTYDVYGFYELKKPERVAINVIVKWILKELCCVFFHKCLASHYKIFALRPSVSNFKSIDTKTCMYIVHQRNNMTKVPKYPLQ